MDHFSADCLSKCLSERGSDRRDVRILEWSWFTSRAVMARRVGVIREEAQSDVTSCLSVNTGRKLWIYGGIVTASPFRVDVPLSS
jgi:hypothetical protein